MSSISCFSIQFSQLEALSVLARPGGAASQSSDGAVTAVLLWPGRAVLPVRRAHWHQTPGDGCGLYIFWPGTVGLSR